MSTSHNCPRCDKPNYILGTRCHCGLWSYVNDSIFGSVKYHILLGPYVLLIHTDNTFIRVAGRGNGWLTIKTSLDPKITLDKLKSILVLV